MILRIFLLFLVTACYAGAVGKEKPKYHRCSYIDSENEKQYVFPEFFLSVAFNSQIHAYKSGAENKEKFHSEALKFFDFYFSCLRTANLSPSAQVFYSRAVSYYELGMFGEAERSLDQALEQDNRHRDTIYMKSRLLVARKNPEKAVELLEEAIQYYSQDSDFLFTLAVISNEMGNFPKALLYFGSLWNTIQKRDGDTKYRVYVLKSLAELYQKKGDVSRSIFYFRSYLKYRPNDFESYFQLSGLLLQIGETQEARDILIDLDKRFPEFKNAKYLLAELYFIENRSDATKYLSYLQGIGLLDDNFYLQQLLKLLQGKHPEVKPFLEKYSEKNPGRLSLSLAMVELYSRLGTEELYIESLKKAAKLAHAEKQNLIAVDLTKKYISLVEKKQGENIGLHYDFIATCYEDMGTLHLALLHIRRAIDSTTIEKEKNIYRMHEASILRHPTLKRYKDSVKILHQVLDNEPTSMVYQSMGITYFLMEKYRESVDYFSRAIEMEPSNPAFYYFRAMAYEKIGYTQDTIVDLKKIIQIDPSNSLSYNFLGYLYAEKNIELEESLKLIRKAIDIEPDNPAYRDSLGWVLYRYGKYEESLHHLQLARQLMEEKKEEDPTVYDHLGDVLLKMNDLNSARESYEKAENLFKEKNEKDKMKEKIKKLELSPK